MDGKLIEQAKPDKPPLNMFGDYGLYSTAGDYAKFLRLFLHGGTLDNVRILSQESIGMMTRNQIGELVVQTQPGAIPSMCLPFPLGAGRDKFGFGFQITAGNDTPSRLRSAGSYGWAGLKNTYFWVDPVREIAAVILMQVYPFYDDACIRVLQGFEELIYKRLV